jgi:hypothetical protein
MGDARDAAETMLAKVEGYRDQYEGVMPPKTFKWSSNVHVPETKATLNAAAAKIADAALFTDPIYEVESEDPLYDDYAQEIENYNEYWHDRTRLRPKGKMAILDSLITGQCWLHPGVEATGKVLPPLPDMFNMEPEQPLSISQLDALPTCNYVITEDMCLLPFTAENFKQANGAFGRTWRRWTDIENGGFYKESVEILRTRWQEDRHVSQTHEQQGIGTSTPQKVEHALFECWEGIYRWKRDGEKQEKDYFMLVAWSDDNRGAATILTCMEYEPLYGKQWFFIPIICSPKPKSMWGGSMCEDMRGLQNWLNATFNQCTNAINMAILPPIAAPATSRLHTDNLKWAPHQKWALQNPQEVQVLQMPSTVFSGINAAMNQTQFVLQVKERVTGVSAVMQGTKQQDNRTKFEVNAVIEQGNDIYKHQVSMIQFGMDEDQGFEAYAACFMNILRNFLPPRPIRYQSRQSSQKWSVATPEMSKGEYRFIPHGNTATTNPEVRFKQTQATRQAVAQSPFCQISPMDTPDGVLAKVKRWYKAESENLLAMGQKRPDLWLGGEPETPEEALAIAFKIDPQAVMQILAKSAPAPTGPGVPGVPGEAGPVLPGQGPGGPGAGLVPALPQAQGPGNGGRPGVGGTPGPAGIAGGGIGIPSPGQLPGMAALPG